MYWYVIYTKPRWEKKVAERLQEIGITVYCPLVTQIRQWSDRKKKVQSPLFKSYVFVQLNEKDRNQIFQVPGAIRYLYWLGKPAVVRDFEIDAIKEWMSLPDVYEVAIETWQPGDRVIIEQGLFKGQEAIVQEVRKNSYMLILEALGCILKVTKKKV